MIPIIITQRSAAIAAAGEPVSDSIAIVCCVVSGITALVLLWALFAVDW